MATARARAGLRGRHRARARDARAHRLRGPLGLRRDRQRDEPRRAAVRRGAAGADPRQPARARRNGPSRDGGLRRRPRAARLHAAGAGVQRAWTADGGGGRMTGVTESLPRLADLAEPERGKRFVRLQERMLPVWDAMRRDAPGESIVVVPSVTPDPTRTGAILQAYE